VAIKEPELREVVITNALKVIVSEMHLSRGMPLKQLAMMLGLSLSRVINAKERILQDEEASASDEVAASVVPGHCSISSGDRFLPIR